MRRNLNGFVARKASKKVLRWLDLDDRAPKFALDRRML